MVDVMGDGGGKKENRKGATQYGFVAGRGTVKDERTWDGRMEKGKGKAKGGKGEGTEYSGKGSE